MNAEHKAIMEAALARDETGASERMGEHLMTTARILLSAPVLSGASDRPRRSSAVA